MAHRGEVKVTIKRKDDGWIRASELAQMGTCERKVRFNYVLGDRRSPDQALAARRGDLAHQAFYREGLALAGAQAPQSRCCIATAVLGHGKDTAVLREFRDQVLRRFSIGRLVIDLYYVAGPLMIGFVRTHPVVFLVAEAMLHTAALLVRPINRLARKQAA